MSEVVAETEVMAEEGGNGPELTTKPAESLGIYYAVLIPVLIKAVQEQQSVIEERAERISDLEARNRTNRESIASRPLGVSVAEALGPGFSGHALPGCSWTDVAGHVTGKRYG
jgi:hypothetical protein